MKQKRAVWAFLLAFLLLIFTGCTEKTEENLPETSSAGSAENTTVTEPVEITVPAAKALIEECRFDEAYEILLALKGDPEADKLLECYIEYPNFTIDFPEEEFEDEHFEVKAFGSPEETPDTPLVLGFNLSPVMDFESEKIEDFNIYYNEKGRISRFSASVNSNLDSLTIDYEYKEDGALLKTTELRTVSGGGKYATKRQEVTEYDEEGRPIRVFNDFETILYTYKDGLLSEKQVQDSYHAYHYEYFYENGRLATVNKNGKLDIKYEYDEDGNLLSIENKSNSGESMKATYETDENGAVIRTETYGDGGIKKYDQKGNLIHYDSPTEGYGNLTYDEAGRLTEAEWSVNYQKQSFQYTYDENGRLKKAVCNRDGREITYTFNEYKAYYLPNAEVRDAVLKALCFGAKSVE